MSVYGRLVVYFLICGHLFHQRHLCAKWKWNQHNLLPKQTQEDVKQFPIPILAKITAVGILCFLLVGCRKPEKSSLFP